MEKNSQSISLVLVTFNRLSRVKNVINALNSYNWDYDQFVIIDNNSTDGTQEYLKTVSKEMDVFLIFNSKNVGHGAALAIAFEYLQKGSNSEYYILLEDDSVPNENMIDKLMTAIVKSNYDIISTYGMNVSLGKRVALKPEGRDILKADFCLLDGAIVRSNVIKVSGVPEKEWFMMFDDFEYCYRIRKNKFIIGVIKNDFHQILHLGGGEKYSRSSLWRGYYQTRNHVLFLRKHFNFFNLIDFIILQIKRCYGAILAPDRWIRIKFRFIGIYHGITLRKGKTLQPDTLKFEKNSL